MSEKTHYEIKAWDMEEFPFEAGDKDEMERLHSILPDGYWLAFDLSCGSNEVVLLRWDYDE